MGAPPRVSTTRHGTRVKKFTAGEASVSVAELLARFGSVTVAGAVIVAVLLRVPINDGLSVPVRV